MKITQTKSQYGLAIDDVMITAKRANNNKRNFLFVSKLLGKHIPIKPNVCQVTGFLLASLIYGETPQTKNWVEYVKSAIDDQAIIHSLEQPYETNERVVVMGFAETATGLGMAVTHAIQGAYFIHTTRERFSDLQSTIVFEEEHSHATTHQCYLTDSKQFEQAEHIILVDDELTTGQSFMNMLFVLQKQTQTKKFTLVTILDWRTEAHKQALAAFCKQTGLDVHVHSLISGEFTITHQKVYQQQEPSILRNKQVQERMISLNILRKRTQKTSYETGQYYCDNGRFGVSYEVLQAQKANYKQAAQKIIEYLDKFGISTNKLLVIGHGEDIFIPNQVANHMKKILSTDIEFKTTTLSPIFCEQTGDYPIHEAHQFYDLEQNTYFFYNKTQIEHTYDAVIFIVERPLAIQLVKNQLTVQL